MQLGNFSTQSAGLGLVVISSESGHSNTFKLALAGSGNVYAPDNSVPTSTWTHLAITKTTGALSSTTTKLYVNGSPVTISIDSSVTPNTASNPLVFGAYTATGPSYGDYFDGKIDDPALFNRALSASDVSALYSGTLSLSSLQQYYSDATTTLAAGTSTTESTVVFGAGLNSSGTSTVRLEVEVQPAGTSFTGVANATSSLISPGGTATTSKTNLSNGSYHWQARVFENGGATSTWQLFGADSTSTDFTVAVPMSAYFDGNDAWAWGVSNIAFDADDPFTIEFWYKLGTSTPSSTSMTLLDSRSGESELGYLVSADKNGVRLTLECAGTTSTVSDLIKSPYFVWDQYPSSEPAWHHVAITKSSAQSESGIKMYFDSIEETVAGSCFTSTSTDKIWFGRNATTTDGSNYLYGYLDEVRIWDAERSSSSIAANDDLELATSTSNLKGYWRFNQTSTDLIANNATSGQAGAPTFSTSSIFGHFILNQTDWPTSANTSTRNLVWWASTIYSSEWLGGVSAWNALGKITFSSTSVSSTASVKVYDVNDPINRFTGSWSPLPNPDEIVFNTAYAAGGTSTQKTATHELGHALGLDHSYINQIMFPFNTNQTTLGSQDTKDFNYFWP